LEELQWWVEKIEEILGNITQGMEKFTYFYEVSMSR